MTVVEKRDSSPEGTQQREDIDLLDHSALIHDMNKSDKLSLEERAKKAKKNRRQQLKLFALYDRAEEERAAASAGKRDVTISFPHDVALMDAAAKGAVEDMRQLLKNGLDSNSKNQEGLTALHNSCIDGNPEMVKLLLEHGASVNVSDKDGWTPLHAAATCGYPEVVKSLIAAGADLLALNGDGDMPYDIADDEETLGIIEDAMRNKGITNETIEEKRTELHTVILADVKALIDEKENLDMPVNEEGATLLHVAISNNFNDVVELLLDNGASVDTQDIEGWKPVHAAAFFGNDNALEMLVLKKGANLRATTDGGLEPLDLADQPTSRKNILTLMDADPSKYKVENKKPIERGSTTPQVFKEMEIDLLPEDDSISDQKIDTILPVTGEPIDDDEAAQALRSLDGYNDFMPVLKRVESISTKRNSMREAKKQTPAIKSSNFIRRDSLDAYDNSYDLLLTKKKPDLLKSNQDDGNNPSLSPVQTLGKIYENDDRSEDLSSGDYATEAHLGTEVFASPTEVINHSDEEPSSTDETPKSGTSLQISTDYDNLLRIEPEKDLPKPFLPIPDTPPTTDTEAVVLQTSPFEDQSSPNLNDHRNEITIPSETTSMASSTLGDGFLDELKRAISPRAATQQKQSTMDLYEGDSSTESTQKKDSQSTSVYETEASGSVNDRYLPPTPVYENDPATKAYQKKEPFANVIYGSEAQTQSLYENDPQSSTLYDTVSSSQPIYESVYEAASSKKGNSEDKGKKETQSNIILTGDEESLYAVVRKTSKIESKKATTDETMNSIPSSTGAGNKSNLSIPSEDAKSKKEMGKPNEGSHSTNQHKNNTLPPFGVPKTQNRDSAIASSPPSVPLRKKFDPLVDNRARATEPARPGTLQDLKLKRQKSRQTLLLDDNDLSPVISRGLESMVFRSVGESQPSPEIAFRPPESPTMNRKVFKAPEITTDTNIFKKKQRCNIM